MLYNERAETTLFLLQSVDGKINTGASDELDPDKDLSRIIGIKEGLYQYYELEEQIDWSDTHVSLSTGRVMAKIGVNDRKKDPKKMDVHFVIIDRKPHLTKNGIIYLTKWVKTLYLITTNNDHPVFEVKDTKNLEIIYFPKTIDLEDLFSNLKCAYKIEHITIQAGGTLNSALLKQKLIDHISIVICPALIGGKRTPTAIDGESPSIEEDLLNVKALTLRKCEVLKHSYVHLQYDVINETRIAPKK